MLYFNRIFIGYILGLSVKKYFMILVKVRKKDYLRGRGYFYEDFAEGA